MINNQTAHLTEADFWSQVGDQESMVVELKQQLPRPSRLQEPLVAFANSRGGTVVVGVSDRRPRQVVGVAWSQDLAEQIQEAARATQPPLQVEVGHRIVGGREVALVEVRSVERGWVQTSDGRLLVRAGPTNRALVGHELLRFVRERAADPVEDEPIQGTSLGDLRHDLLRQFIRSRLGRSRVNFASTARDLGLLTSDRQARLATLRDYSLRGAAVEVRLYDDAVEVESPGTLAAYVTVDNLREAQYSRNERIMDALQRLGLVEEAGQGIDRMIAEMEDALLAPPEFEERAASFVVRLRGGSVFAAEDRLWVSRFGRLELSADAKVALVFARRRGAITNEQLRRLRPLDRQTSRTTLQDLVARGLLEAFGRGRGTGYRLSDAALEARAAATLGEQLRTVLNHARRSGVVVNSDVRGLLGVDAAAARSILEELVLRGLLVAEGERRGRRYLAVRSPEG